MEVSLLQYFYAFKHTKHGTEVSSFYLYRLKVSVMQVKILAINWEFRTIIFHSRSKEIKINFCSRGLTDVISLNKCLAIEAGQSVFI